MIFKNFGYLTILLVTYFTSVYSAPREAVNSGVQVEKVVSWSNLTELLQGGWEIETLGTARIIDVSKPSDFNVGYNALDGNSSFGVFGSESAERYGAGVLTLKLKNLRSRSEFCGILPGPRLRIKFFDQSFSRFSVFPCLMENRVCFGGRPAFLIWREEEHELHYNLALDIIEIKLPLNQDNFILFDEIAVAFDVSSDAPCQ